MYRVDIFFLLVLTRIAEAVWSPLSSITIQMHFVVFIHLLLLRSLARNFAICAVHNHMRVIREKKSFSLFSTHSNWNLIVFILIYLESVNSILSTILFRLILSLDINCWWWFPPRLRDADWNHKKWINSNVAMQHIILVWLWLVLLLLLLPLLLLRVIVSIIIAWWWWWWCWSSSLVTDSS